MATGKKTLDRLLSRAGVCSRSEAQACIRAGRVTVNGRVVRSIDTWIDEVRDKVQIDGAPLRARGKQVWLLHKPVGYVTTAADELGRDTVYALLPADATWLAPVGRLDRDSSGLLLFTNDSDLANAITAPASKLPKVYEVTASGPLRDEQLHTLRTGVELVDGPTLPCEVERRGDDAATTRLCIVLTEGRNRQLRRMLQAVGSQVLSLHRGGIGPLRLGDLEVGACRRLGADEVLRLRDAVARRRSARK